MKSTGGTKLAKELKSEVAAGMRFAAHPLPGQHHTHPEPVQSRVLLQAVVFQIRFEAQHLSDLVLKIPHEKVNVINNLPGCPAGQWCGSPPLHRCLHAEFLRFTLHLLSQIHIPAASCITSTQE